ncbi:Gfo/Idh/MocA family protein [Coraliomargarita sp. W4R53]
MSQKTVKWGILACGKIANAFAEALKEAEGSELYAVAAREVERAQVFAEVHGAAQAYGSYEALLADPEVDAVYIATIHPHHLQWVKHCAYAGKHVLCEKPLAMNLREAKQAQKVAKDRRVLLREAFMYRHHPQTQQVVDLVESGAIGKVRLIDAKFCFNSGVEPESRTQARALGGGGILDVGCYVMSFARLIAGRAQGRLFSEPLELKAVGHLDMQTKTDMFSTVSLRFEGDVLANCSCAVRLQAANQCVIYGEAGRITLESPWRCQGAVRVDYDDARESETYEAVSGRNLYVYEIESFAGEMSGRPIGARAVGMRLDDTLGNIKALDWWRSEIGLAYEADRLA